MSGRSRGRLAGAPFRYRAEHAIACIALLELAGACHPRSKENGATGEVLPSRHNKVAALADDCTDTGPKSAGVVQFTSICPQSVKSPDGRWLLVQSQAVGEDEIAQVHVESADGRTVGPIPALSDGMPFALRWLPRAGWFEADHHIGSFMDVPEVFEITAQGVVKHESFAHTAQAEAHRMYPCLPPDRPDIWLAGSTFEVSHDGKRLAWAFTTRPDMCAAPGYTGPIKPEWRWESFLMISDLNTGEIIPGSVRILPNKPFAEIPLPTDGPYKGF